MGYNNRGIEWNDEKVKTEIREIINVLNIDRMPSASEMEMVTGNAALSCKIAKTGGFYKWADKLGLKVKNCETKTGKGYEEITFNLLKDKGYSVKRMSVKYPFDLIVNNKVSIDVKVGNVYMLKGSRVHTVGVSKKFATCDLYIVFALNEQKKVEKTFIIPGIELDVVTMSFGSKSKYDKYINRWDYIDKYLEFYNGLK